MTMSEVVKLNGKIENTWIIGQIISNTVENHHVKDDKDLDILTDKGVYPYDYMNAWDKFNETELPKKEDFYSKLYDEHISEDDYERARLVWNRFNLKDLGEYHDLYLRCDVLQLTDVFENFRNMFKILWIRPSILHDITKFCMGCHVENDWDSVRFSI